MTAPVRRLPRVLVLLASFDGARWVGEQLGSILDQRDVDVRIIVSDDRSRDGTAEAVQDVAMRDGRVLLRVRAASSGSAGANFRSMFAEVEFADVDFIALADQDDIWAPDHLSRGCDALLEHPGAAGYSCAVRTFGAGTSAVLLQCSRPRTLDHLFEGAGQGCSFVITVDLAQRVQRACRGFPAAVAALHYHDWLIYLVARCAARAWVFDEHPSLNYRQHGSNEIGARSGAGAVRRRFALIRSGWFRRQVEAASAIAQALGDQSAVHQHFRALMEASMSPWRRVRLAHFVARHGRRRLGDRLVLVAAAVCGWL